MLMIATLACAVANPALSVNTGLGAYPGKKEYGRGDVMAEQMVSFKRIHEIKSKIIDEFHPERIVLFGSYARGEETPNSDVDLLVIMPSFPGKNVLKAIEILKRIKPAFPIDLLVRTSDQVQRRVAMNDYFLKGIMEKGAVLYEADHARMA